MGYLERRAEYDLLFRGGSAGQSRADRLRAAGVEVREVKRERRSRRLAALVCGLVAVGSGALIAHGCDTQQGQAVHTAPPSMHVETPPGR